MLSATTPEALKKIAEYEAEGRLNEHPEGMFAPAYRAVTGDYRYLTANPFKNMYTAFCRQFIVKPFMRYTNKLLRTEVRGEENLEGIRGAIVCCNHVNKLDCMAIAYALNRRTYTTAAEFNNMSGFLGDMMRVGGMLPLSADYRAMANLDRAISKLLDKGKYITFFPEGSEWWCYEKPRPQLIGAYRYAVKNGVPVVPVFITFKPTPESESQETGLKQFIVNILPPVYADLSLPPKQAALKMRDECADAWAKMYAQFYQAE